jgi:carbonic anhydrase/acetyltransferase-like protein (isoleucine patch superfamily)
MRAGLGFAFAAGVGAPGQPALPSRFPIPGADCRTPYNPRSMLRPYRGQWPQLDASVFVDQSAQVIGDVAIGPDSSIWMQCVVRGDVHRIRIGSRTNIQDGTVVHVMRGTHPTTIGDEVTIGHAAVIHGCTIEDRCLIGMGAIILNGAVIGRDSIVAAGTLVTEGCVIPSRSLVMGSPGKVRRPLSDAEVASILDYAERYVGYRLDYMDDPPAQAAAPAGEVRG